MIIVELSGGLGNQMFQYACGKAYSLRHNQPLFIDRSFLQKNQTEVEGFTPRKYELQVYRLDAAIASAQLIKPFAYNTRINRAFKLLKLPYYKTCCEEPAKGVEQLNEIAPPVLLKGYWQSERYFGDCKEEIRDAFTINADRIAGYRDTISQINQTNSVSIHYRRGDYLTNPVAKNVLGPLGPAYYQEAINLMKSKIADPFFYIFSDEPEWVKDNLPVSDNYKLMDSLNPGKPHYDLFLMSKCKHHIIANSSFSWWGAWLNADPQKVVIAPKRWFANEQINIHSTQIAPPQWIRI